MIEIENLTKRFGNFCAVDGISLRVDEGEVFGFLGPNGAGKTTTLKMLAGVLKPTSGSICIGGYDMQEQALEAKAITGYVPERPYVYNKLTGREYLYFVADLHSVEGQQAEANITEQLGQYGLTKWEDELIESYSHGMKQRLAICAALVHGPKVLIIDEPMVGLDPHGAKLIKAYFREYAKRGMTVMLSTHSLNVAEEVSDRLAVIDNGLIISVGTLSEMRRQVGVSQEGLEAVFLRLTHSSANEPL